MEKLGKKLGFTMDNKKFHNVSLGQGQEVVAEAALDTAAEHGHWVVLQVQIFYFYEFHRLIFTSVLVYSLPSYYS